jgi:hypothetical protein
MIKVIAAGTIVQAFDVADDFQSEFLLTILPGCHSAKNR